MYFRKKSRNISANSSRGSGLLEVLIAVLVLSIGMLSIARLHSTLIKEGSAANNRAIAVKLAQTRLDQLRQFRYTGPDASRAINPDCSQRTALVNNIEVNVSCFTSIAAEANAQLVEFANIDSNTTFSWQVTAVNGNNTQRDVTVAVSWADAVDPNNVQTVQLTSTIFAINAEAQAIGDGSGIGAMSDGPKVFHNPGALPDVVAIDLNNNDRIESDRPTPSVSRHGHSVVVNFETTTFKTSNNQALAVADYSTVSCVCTSDSDGPAYTPARWVWYPGTDSKAPLPEIELGTLVTKSRGRVPNSGQVASQDPLCDICCRDHHDVNDNSYPKYDPARPATDYTNNTHNHYNLATDISGSNIYLESCRMVRADGIYRVMQDWNLRDILVIPKDNYLDNQTNFQSYTNYVESVLQYQFAGGTPPTKPTRPIIELVPSQQAQLLARGIYLDNIYNCRPGNKSRVTGEACNPGSNPNQINTAYQTYVNNKIQANDREWLRQAVFAEVNLTVLASWSAGNVNGTTPPYIQVDNQYVQNIFNPDTNYYTTYYRGRVTGTTSAGDTNITAEARVSNTGFTSGVYSSSTRPQGWGTDTHDESTVITDSIVVRSIGSVATFGISGSFNRVGASNSTLPKPSAWGATASPSTGVTCSATGNSANNMGYSCTVPSGWSGTITPTATTNGRNPADHSGTSYFFRPTSRTFTNVTAGITGQNFDICINASLCQ